MLTLPPSEITTVPTYGALFATGALLHLSVFRFGEWDLYTPRIITAAAALNVLLTCSIWSLTPDHEKSCWQALRASSLFQACTIAGTYTSILLYRAFFHRLCRFPGPFAARLSNFYITTLSVKKFQLYEETKTLHSRYGDYVRVGPSTLSITDPKALLLVHSNRSPCVKGPWYNIMHPVISLHMTRNRQEHARRRKVWDQGLSTKALRTYEPRVAEHTEQLLSKIDQSVNESFDVSTWSKYYGYDIMGDLAFGESFHMLRDGVAHYCMRTVHASIEAVSALSHLPWVLPLLRAIPLLNSEQAKFQKWLEANVEKRRRDKDGVPDLFSWVLADYEAIRGPTSQDTINLYGDAQLIVVAGSGTTAVVLTCLFLELAQHPRVAQTLQRELDEHFAEHERPENHSLSKLGYLQACIDETLRLHPQIPSGLQRMTPPEGLQIGDAFVPGDTIIQIPSATLNRDERCFSRPGEFIPERWTSQPELVKDASVFAPFSIGRYSCVGKQLALMELRYVVSQVVHRYDVKMALGQTRQAFIGGVKDAIGLAVPPLNVVFTRRADEMRI